MSQQIRILALDLDGTLLDSNKNLSAVNREALARAAANGVHVVPTTGRFFGMMPEAVRNLPFVRYAITINGAQVYDRETDAAIVREEIPLATALDVMALLDDYDVIYDCYRANWGWMTKSLQDKAADYATNDHYLRMVRSFRKPVPDLKAHLRETAAEGDVQKIMLFATNRDRDAALAVLAALQREIAVCFPEIKVTSSTWNNLELNVKTAHKGRALAGFARHLGLGLENCMAIGDGMNDFTMVECAGVGVAMANADDEVKRVAKFVTTSNDEDGVAAALARFGLDREAGEKAREGLKRTIIQVGSFEVNCTLLSANGKAWIVDPGNEADRILALLKGKGLEPAAILLTHAHFDHIGGIAGLQKAYPALPVCIGAGDRVMFGHPANQYPPDYPSAPMPRNLVDATRVAELLPGACAIPTPGHTPGGVSYYLKEDRLLLSGDTLFAGSVGRTDLPGGDMATLMASLASLVTLPDETEVIPGHGPFTTMGAEKRDNPFLR